ncbi:hypothetical protein LCGC14_0659250 [marine sediment metagenome]|uniref:Uncharacterized protein n=1 Tax=marine sediment metagenome TaxID=412755 RepID=A0A0F9QZ87_9ZZZZ
MNLNRKRAHLEGNTIRFGRLETGVALITILIATSSLVGNYFIGNERSERNDRAIAALTVQVAALTTSQAVTINDVKYNGKEISEHKAEHIRLATKAHKTGD